MGGNELRFRCADVFESAWDRDGHFGAYHLVLDLTLLRHTPPQLQHIEHLAALRLGEDESAGPAARVERATKSDGGGGTTKRSRQKPAEQCGDEDEGPQTRFKYIYYISRGAWRAVITEANGRTQRGRWTSSGVPTEAEALAFYAAESTRRGLSQTVPPLKDHTSRGGRRRSTSKKRQI
ncbi:hypothetical protein T492DRAFT_836106 [Pavlovales sp. CCMP2436]|nr:hypothetical protein T492DRAFT_836106 [Pavlovales sp. CCMP2436]